MLENISKIDVYIGLAITGLESGLGNAIGSYLANKHIIEGTKNLYNKLKNK